MDKEQELLFGNFFNKLNCTFPTREAYARYVWENCLKENDFDHRFKFDERVVYREHSSIKEYKGKMIFMTDDGMCFARGGDVRHANKWIPKDGELVFSRDSHTSNFAYVAVVKNGQILSRGSTTRVDYAIDNDRVKPYSFESVGKEWHSI